jgi:hypothetical protein
VRAEQIVLGPAVAAVLRAVAVLSDLRSRAPAEARVPPDAVSLGLAEVPVKLAHCTRHETFPSESRMGKKPESRQLQPPTPNSQTFESVSAAWELEVGS